MVISKQWRELRVNQTTELTSNIMNKIELEVFNKKYLPVLISWYSNPNNRKYMLTQTINEKDALKIIRNGKDRKCYCIKLNDFPIGYVVLLNIQSKVGRVVIMIDEPFTKKEYGQQTLSLLEELAKELEIEKLTLEVRTDNAPAVSLYKKMGFNLKYTEAVMEKRSKNVKSDEYKGDASLFDQGFYHKTLIELIFVSLPYRCHP